MKKKKEKQIECFIGLNNTSGNRKKITENKLIATFSRIKKKLEQKRRKKITVVGKEIEEK